MSNIRNGNQQDLNKDEQLNLFPVNSITQAAVVAGYQM